MAISQAPGATMKPMSDMTERPCDMAGPRQFTLYELFGIMMFVGAGCAAGRYIVIAASQNGSTIDPLRVVAVSSISASVFGVIGLWRRRFVFWLTYGIAMAILIGFLYLLSLRSGA